MRGDINIYSMYGEQPYYFHGDESCLEACQTAVAQLVEHAFSKRKVSSSTLDGGYPYARGHRDRCPPTLCPRPPRPVPANLLLAKKGIKRR